ncbi:helix-turn-helix domain-containing protein [Streptomyces caniscabiei]|uniref:helix-turn-helix domain-containing protein n=1 Tax=Streptomyces caniscabiei TaxID=2746961 RepID=UPI0007661AA7|nr:helix-turn-helix domain-containing protein [Streptomyces caniscabiei]
MSVTARARLLAYLQQSGLSTARAEANLDAYAHELAETVRELSRQGYSAQEAANKIDPKKSVGPVRPDEEPT